MTYTKQKKVHRTLEGVVTDIKAPKSNYKARPIFVSDHMVNYIRDRERLFYMEAVKNGNLDELNRIAKYLNFEVRDKDRINFK